MSSELVRQIARRLKDAGYQKAPEIGVGIVEVLAKKARKGTKNKPGNEEWFSLLGLATVGAAVYGRHVLKENAITVTRRGQTVTIAGGYAIPDIITSNGVALQDDDDDDEEPPKPDGNIYIQFDFMSWSTFFIVLDGLRRQLGAIHAVVVTFEEISKLYELHPHLSVGEAMVAEGFNPNSRSIDLDRLEGAS